MQDLYKNIEEYKPRRKCNALLVFDDMIADMVSNNKPCPIVTELFIRGRKLDISTVFITQSYFFIMKIPNKCELQQIAFNHLSDIGFEDIITLYKECPSKPYYFLVIRYSCIK